jgi:uncharacterized membrane protein YcaP (DUF421 family)
MSLVHIAVRALVAYGVLFVLLRTAGKRTIVQGTPFDFVLALVLGDMVDDLLWAEVGLASFAVAVSTLVLLQTGMAVAQRRFAGLHGLVNGRTVVVLKDGRAESAGLHAERMHEKDLEALLRLHGVSRERWSDIQIARLEPHGALSVRRRDEAQELERGELERRI